MTTGDKVASDSPSVSLNKNTNIMKYIDLGLPSGTLWAESNEEGFYTFDKAVEKYGNGLPTKEQLKELTNHCQWEWVGNGYKVTGHNGNSIILPAEGSRNCYGSVYNVGFYGFYWSSTSFDSGHAWCLSFNSGDVDIYCINHYFGFSVRLIKLT